MTSDKQHLTKPEADIWEELKEKNEMARCADCGKRFWKYWYTPSMRVKGATEYQEMFLCATCYFGD